MRLLRKWTPISNILSHSFYKIELILSKDVIKTSMSRSNPGCPSYLTYLDTKNRGLLITNESIFKLSRVLILEKLRLESLKVSEPFSTIMEIIFKVSSLMADVKVEDAK